MRSVAKIWRPLALLFIAAVADSASAQPIITTQPANQSVLSGSNATFSVTASGAAPLAYQWRLAGTNLPGATNASLLLTNVQIGNGGLVTVVITNASGAIVSQTALLVVDEHLTFRILELGTNGVLIIDHNGVTGDNRGGVAVSSEIVLVNGDSQVARFSAANLSGGTPLGTYYEGLVGDLRAERIYCLGNGTNLISSVGGTVNTLIELDGETGLRTGGRITLSTNISLGYGSGVFSGYGRIVLWDVNTSRTYDISLPSGRVTLLATVPGISRVTSEIWGFWGIAEYFAGSVSLVYVQNSQTIARRRVSATTDLTVAQSFGNLGTMANISFSPSRSRWYFHHINTSQFRATVLGTEEFLGSAKALYTADPGFPAIYADPLSRTVFPSNDVTLSVTAFGSQPLQYQWRLNGTNLLDATNATLVLTNIQPTATGNYSVVVANELGSITSANAFVFVISVPQILVQPQPRSVAPGTNTTFSAIIQAAPPVSLQWRLNGTNIPNATNISYTIPVVSSADVGNYSLVASNRYGTSSSVAAALTLLVDSGSTFRVVSLGTDATLTEHRTLTGDDRGGIAVSPNSVFITGDSATTRFNASDLADGSTIGFFDSLVSDLRSQRVFVLMSNLTVIGNSGGTITVLRELDPNTGALTTNMVPLSSRITVPAVGTGAVGLFAGYGQVVIHTGSRCYSIAVPSGIVGDLGPMSSFTHRISEAWAYWGVAENFGGAIYLVYAQTQTSIMRTRVPDGITTTVANFINLSDMASFTVSVPRNRWYFHYQGVGEFGGTNETLGFCSATFAVSVSQVVDHFKWEPFGSQQGSGVPFAVTVTARDADDNIVTNFTGNALLQGISVGSQQPVTVVPPVLSNFTNGVWRGDITVSQSTPGMVLRAYDLAGHSGVSAALSVSAADNLAVQIFPSAPVATLNSGFSYSISVTNSGPSASTGVMLTNVLPVAVNFSGATASQGSCTVAAGTVVCDLGSINGGANATVTLELTPNSLDALTNSVRVTRGQVDAEPADNAITLITPVALPTITITDASVTEANAAVLNVFAVSLNATNSTAITVQFSTTPVTATNFGDYIARSGTLTFAPGVTSTNIAITISGDTRYEGSEFFLVNLFNPVNATLVRTQAVGTIVDDDAPPVLTLIPSSLSTNEGNSGVTTVLMNARLSTPAAVLTRVNVSTADGSALAGADYFATNGLITFTNGASNVVLSFRIIGDIAGESNDFFFINLTNALNVTLAQTQAVVTILNDDPIGVDHYSFSAIAPVLKVNVPFPVTVTARDYIERVVSNGIAPVALTGLGGRDTLNATIGSGNTNWIYPMRTFWHDARTQVIFPASDFRGLQQIQSLALNVLTLPGQTMNNWTIRMKHTPLSSYGASPQWENTDWTVVYQRNETVASLGWVTFVFSTPFQYNGVDNVMIDFSHNNTSFTSDGSVSATTTPTTRAITYFCDSCLGDPLVWPSTGTTTPQQAQLVPDIRLTGIGALKISPGTSGNFTNGVWSGTVRVLEPGEDLRLQAYDANQHTGVSGTFSAIAEDDLALRISTPANPTPLNENLIYSIVVSNTGPAVSTGVIITNRLPSGAAFISASLDRGLGVTRAGSILSADVGTLASGATAMLSVLVRPGSAMILTNAASVTRNEAESYTANNFVTNVTAAVPLTLAVNDVSLREGQSGTTNAVFTVTLSAMSTQMVSVAYATGNNSATVADDDFLSVSGTLMFGPGVTNLTVAVPVIGDVFNELNETFLLNLSNATNAAIADLQGVATIVNDDPLPTIAINDITVTEGRSGLSAATFALSLSAPTSRSVSVNASTSDGSAFAGSDYVGTNVFVSFAPRQTNLAVSVLIRGDTLNESEEVFFLNLSGPGNATLAAVQGRATILNNDGSGGSNRFEWALSPGALAFGKPFDVTISARDAQGALQPFSGIAALRAFSGTDPVTISPTSTSNFVNGLWSGTVTVLSVVTNFYLVADDGAGRTGNSDPLQLGWADVALAQSTVPAADLGTTFNYTLTVSNRGPHTATSINAFNVLPDLDFVSATSSQGGCTYQNGTVTCALGSLTNGQNATITMVMKPRRGGVVTNTAVAFAFESDLAPTNNIVSGVVTITGDDDRDGMANEWEVLNGFSPTDPLDANQDADADGHSNLQEYIAGTNPQNASSVLRLAGALNNGQLQLSFRSVAGRVYRLEWTADPRFGPWAGLSDEITGDGDLLVTADPGGLNQSARFYRVRVVR